MLLSESFAERSTVQQHLTTSTGREREREQDGEGLIFSRHVRLQSAHLWPIKKAIHTFKLLKEMLHRAPLRLEKDGDFG